MVCKSSLHAGFGNIGNGIYVGAFLALAAGIAHFFGNAAAQGKRQAQKQPAHPRAADDGAVFLILRVVGAHFVAVREQNPPAVPFDDAGFGQNLHSGAGGIGITQQEVAVAGHEIHGGAAGKGGQCFGHLRGGAAWVVVARPCFEQVAQNIQFGGGFGVLVQEAAQQAGQLRFVVGKVQIGNE